MPILKSSLLLETSTNITYSFIYCEAYSLGQRAQSARTYFENQLGNYNDCPLETLILHGLKALHTGVGNDEELTEKNIEVAHVGEEGFKLLKADEIKGYLEKLQNVLFSLPSLTQPTRWTRNNLINFMSAGNDNEELMRFQTDLEFLQFLSNPFYIQCNLSFIQFLSRKATFLIRGSSITSNI